MIEPERILYYFEHVALLIDDQCMEDSTTQGHEDWRKFHQESLRKFLDTFYMFCHIGTASMHGCQHPDWEADFLKIEQQMIDAKQMKPYVERKAEGPNKLEFMKHVKGEK